MTHSRPTESPPLIDDEHVLTHVSDLVMKAHRRQLWLFLIDSDHRPQSTLPILDLPHRSDGLKARYLPDALCMLMADTDAAELAIVYERPGKPDLSNADRSWFRLFVAGCRLHEIPLRGPILAHSRGVRWIAPDDLG